MILVPVLLGFAVLSVAVHSRWNDITRLDLPESANGSRIKQTRDNPLRSAFPELNLWVPTEEYWPQHTDQAGSVSGNAGPDIIILPAQCRPTTQQLSDAA